MSNVFSAVKLGISRFNYKDPGGWVIFICSGLISGFLWGFVGVL